ncbi:hypothetical protein FJY68_04670 [candidate division WOR-3 bacterium]|uniref:Uncharacterized protein n=1 Tax=candidate division WOR-3 bacterium TaxID=2052148 RepID=A0A937XDP2_UNCW3|nr:hypothetical protein [candidate division WOR-3 bacterium]
MKTARLFVTILILAAGMAAQESPRQYVYRPLSVSFVPGVATNSEPWNVSSDYSFNIIGGQLGRLQGIELGGVYNYEEDDVLGYQAAGVFNRVGRDFTGLQQAGVVNIVGREFGGVQTAGAVNVLGGCFGGLQMAGAANIVGGCFTGLQMAGAANIVDSSVYGAQMAGSVNVTGGHLWGAQLSGAVNIAEEFTGAQIGLVNICGTGRGLQFGLVNIAEEVDVPIGLVSIVENGQFHVNAWASEYSLLNLGIKTGSRSIYNIFMVGCRPDGDLTRLIAGMGIGGHIPLQEFFVDIDALGGSVYGGPDWFREGQIALLSSLRMTGGWQLSDKLALTAGPSVNVRVSEFADEQDGTLLDMHEDWDVRVWPGFTIGFQLL